MEKFEEEISYPEAPRRFQYYSESDEWEGKPSIPYGIVRYLAFQERKNHQESYMRLQFAEAGRRGDPWGGLHMEINGYLYHFGAGMKRYPHLHNGEGGLTEEGNQLLAEGLLGEMTFDWIDWKWVQDETDISGLFSQEAICKIERYFKSFRVGERTVPYFQSRIWTKRLGVPLKPEHFNCTTFITERLNPHLPECLRR